MKKIVLIVLLLLFINSCAKNLDINNSYSFPPFGTDSTLDIITWNIQSFPKQQDITVNYLAELIDLMNVDIIAMQEIWGDGASNSFENLKNKLNGWDGHRKSSGLAYLYKTEIEVSNISEINELNDIIRTPYLLSIAWNGQNIYVINNHFKAFSGTENEEERKTASEQMEGYINEYLEDLNVIFLGDLNDKLDDDESVNVFQNFINDSTNYKFVDMNLAYGSKANWSYPNYPSHIDHILITNELFDEFESSGSSIQIIHLEDYFKNGWGEYEQYISDHRPVGLSLKFNP